MLKLNRLFQMKALFLIASFILALICSVDAFAIASSYGPGIPLKMQPGETRDIQLSLMASPKEDNLIINAELINNGSIASLIDPNTEYKVNVGEIVPVNLRVIVNKAAKTGEEYSITIKFSDITPSEAEGSVSFKGSSTISLNVLVAQPEFVSVAEPELKEAKKGIGIFFIFGFFLLILIISIILVIWLVIRNRKK